MGGDIKSLIIEQMCRAYALMISAYPRSFREHFGREMHLTFRSEAKMISAKLGGKGLFALFLRVSWDWIVTLRKEYFDMPRLLIASALILSLVAVNWLTFHDLFEPHTVRDYVTLAASLLAFVYVGLDILRSHRAPTRAH